MSPFLELVGICIYSLEISLFWVEKPCSQFLETMLWPTDAENRTCNHETLCFSGKKKDPQRRLGALLLMFSNIFNPGSSSLKSCRFQIFHVCSIWQTKFLSKICVRWLYCHTYSGQWCKTDKNKSLKESNTVQVFPRICLGRPDLGESKQQWACTAVEQKYISCSYSVLSGNRDKVNQSKSRVKNEPKSNERD